MALAVQGPEPGPLPANADTAHILRFQSPPTGRLHPYFSAKERGEKKTGGHPPTWQIITGNLEDRPKAKCWVNTRHGT